MMGKNSDACGNWNHETIAAGLRDYGFQMDALTCVVLGVLLSSEITGKTTCIATHGFSYVERRKTILTSFG